MSTGAQFYPGASLAYRYDSRYPGLMQEINCCVTHTTEGTSLPDYDGGVSAPNTTILPDIPNKRIKVYAHFPADMSARALVDNPNTEVRTNRNNCHQVELVGSCDPNRRVSWGKLRAGVDYIYWPDAPDWLLRAYAEYLRWLHTEHGVPLVSTPRPWLAYPGSYGNSKARMALDEWAKFKGHCGHMHVPDGNDHGDPGNTRMDLVLAYARGENPTTTSPEDEEDPMAGLTKEDIAHATLYWLNEAMEETPESAGTHPLAGVVASLNAKFKANRALISGIPEKAKLTPAQIAAAFTDGVLDANVDVNINVKTPTPKAS
ncbi:hypothetical protein OG592_26950 [Streptomyces avidinii]|uniref:hypothetical protein n=1 Tax=Streptomyces avidinii TaxID=1895 RepID=UPI0038695D00|nr:hypothetical protein OG592_26950 [Streptomyces avidinii]